MPNITTDHKRKAPVEKLKVHNEEITGSYSFIVIGNFAFISTQPFRTL